MKPMLFSLAEIAHVARRIRSWKLMKPLLLLEEEELEAKRCCRLLPKRNRRRRKTVAACCRREIEEEEVGVAACCQREIEEEEVGVVACCRREIEEEEKVLSLVAEGKSKKKKLEAEKFNPLEEEEFVAEEKSKKKNLEVEKIKLEKDIEMAPKRMTVDSVNDVADRASFSANKEQNTFFLELVLREVTREGFRGVSLTMASWSQVIKEFNGKYHTNYRQRTFKNMFDYLRALYAMWRKLVSISGHGLSADINTLMWPEEKWNELKVKYPDVVEKFKNKPLPDAELLISIFEGTLAKRDQAWTHLSSEPCLNDDEPIEGFTRHSVDDEDPYFQGWSMERDFDTPGAYSDAGTSHPVKSTSQS